MKYSFLLNGQTQTIDLQKTVQGYRTVWNDQTLVAEIVKTQPGELSLNVDGRLVTAYWASDGTRRWVFIDGRTFVLTPASIGGPRSSRQTAEGGPASDEMIAAPMPGRVRAVQVAEGDTVVKGQTLFVLEAMKMEISVRAPRDGKLVRVKAQTGQSVELNQVLAEIE